jgi:hypothetical protein
LCIDKKYNILEIWKIKKNKKEINRIEVLDDIDEHEASCLHKPSTVRCFGTSQHRIKTVSIEKNYLTWV